MWSLEPSCGGGGKLRVSQRNGLQGVRPRREVGGWGAGRHCADQGHHAGAEFGAAANKLIAAFHTRVLERLSGICAWANN